MSTGDAVDNRQAKSGADHVAACGFEAGKGKLEAFDFLRGNPRAAITDVDKHSGLLLAQTEQYWLRAGGMPQGIVDKVGDRTAQALRPDS